METFLFISESVNEGHPDKLRDQISYAVLDACLAQDPNSKVACETCTKLMDAKLRSLVADLISIPMPTIVVNGASGVGDGQGNGGLVAEGGEAASPAGDRVDTDAATNSVTDRIRAGNYNPRIEWTELEIAKAREASWLKAKKQRVEPDRKLPKLQLKIANDLNKISHTSCLMARPSSLHWFSQ
ncbi:hypothetical protein EV1_043038 [Malus domestica]